MSTAAIIAVIVAVATGFHLWRAWRAPYAYLRGREPDTQLWRRRYPGEEFATVVLVLEAIADGFLLRRSDVHRLRPEDRLSAIYEASYPLRFADALEFESLQMTLREVFHVPEEELNTLWDATVEDVVQMCLASTAPDT